MQILEESLNRTKLNQQVLVIFDPAHEIMAPFVLRKLILQTRMRGHPVGLDVGFWSDPLSTSILYAFAGRPCDKYHNLISWLNIEFLLSNTLQQFSIVR